ncbi:MAG: DUF4494 domain-containing protein [Cyclobacteriaceae bacterium]|nr:DUF4494 domain-containing protein [Cyclobacteriaceae bacterium]
MKIWYSCKVKYAKEQENGMLKQVTEAYLVDAVSYTDAESRIYGAMERDIAREFAVTQISKTNITEVVGFGDYDRWFKCKVSYSTVDGDKDKEVKINNYYLVNADTIQTSLDVLHEAMKSFLVDYDIPAISLTNFVEVYPYSEDEIPANFRPLDEDTEDDDAELVDEETGEVSDAAEVME